MNWVKMSRNILANELVKKDGHYIGYITYMVMMAQHSEEYNHNGFNLKRGQFITSYSKFCEVFGLTMREARTIFDHLKSTSIISTKTTNKATIVTVLNYGLYQDSVNNDTTSKTTSKTTTEQECINKKDKQEYKYTTFSDEQFEVLKSYRSRIKKPFKTQQAVTMIDNQFKECLAKGYSFDEVYNLMAERQWQTVNVEWVSSSLPKKVANDTWGGWK